MDRLSHKKISAQRRSNRVRTAIKGSMQRPRLSVHISNTHISAQIIDDSKMMTVAYATTVGQKISGTMSDKAAWVGKQIALNAKKSKVKTVVFDRGSRKYHGRIKALADSARAEGLEF